MAMERADAAWRAELRSQTLGELATEVAEVLTPVVVRKATAWLAVAAR
jgi:hypothetical protein